MVLLSHSWKQLVCQCTSNCAGPHITCTDNRKVSIGPPKICHRKHATLYRCCITLVIGKTKAYMLMEIHKSSHHIPKISLRNSLSNPTCWAWTFKYPTPFCILQHCKKQANTIIQQPQLRPWLGKHGTTLQMLQIKSCADTVWKAWQGEIQPQNKFIGLWFSTLCWTGAAIKFHSNITTSHRQFWDTLFNIQLSFLLPTTPLSNFQI